MSDHTWMALNDHTWMALCEGCGEPTAIDDAVIDQQGILICLTCKGKGPSSPEDAVEVLGADLKEMVLKSALAAALEEWAGGGADA